MTAWTLSLIGFCMLFSVPSLYGQDAAFYLKQGEIWFNKRNYNRAIADYTRALKIDSRSVDAYLARGLAWEGIGNYAMSIPDYTKAIELNPHLTIEAYYKLGLGYYNTGQYGRAIAAYTRGMKINPRYHKLYYGRALAWEKLSNHDKALADARKTFCLYPKGKYKDLYWKLLNKQQ